MRHAIEQLIEATENTTASVKRFGSILNDLFPMTDQEKYLYAMVSAKNEAERYGKKTYYFLKQIEKTERLIKRNQ